MNSKLSATSRCLFVAAAILIPVTLAIADTPAFDQYAIGVRGTSALNFNGTRGWEFGHGLGTSNLLITRLGVFDGGGDGLAISHEVGVWLRNPGGNTGTLLMSATVPAGTVAPLIDGFRWVEIAPLLISFNTVYSIGAYYSDGDVDLLTTPAAPVFTHDIGQVVQNGRFAYGPGLAFPYIYRSSAEGQIGERFYAANFRYEVVPEPSLGLLLVSGLAYLFLRRRRSVSRLGGPNE